MKGRIIEDICGSSVIRPHIKLNFPAGAIVDVVQESEDLGRHTLYSITDAFGDYIHVYSWEFSPVEE